MNELYLLQEFYFYLAGYGAARFIHCNSYVNDGLKLAAGPEEAIDLVLWEKGIRSVGAIRLHKFVSNSKTVMQSIAPVDLASGTHVLNLLKGDNHIERVSLGMQWCIEIDKFTFRITLQDQPCTRRGIHSTVNSVYDPLALLAPVKLKGKIILQEMC